MVNECLQPNTSGNSHRGHPGGDRKRFHTGNRLFSNLSEAIQALARPSFRQFDVMLVQDADGPSRYAVNSVGVGSTPMCASVAELESKKIGSRSYAFEVLRGLRLSTRSI